MRAFFTLSKLEDLKPRKTYLEKSLKLIILKLFVSCEL